MATDDEEIATAILLGCWFGRGHPDGAYLFYPHARDDHEIGNELTRRQYVAVNGAYYGFKTAGDAARAFNKLIQEKSNGKSRIHRPRRHGLPDGRAFEGQGRPRGDSL